MLESLTNLSVFDKLYTPIQKFDLFRYWYDLFSMCKLYVLTNLNRRALEQHLKSDVVAEYLSALGRSSQFPHGVIVGDLFYRVANFLEETGKYLFHKGEN